MKRLFFFFALSILAINAFSQNIDAEKIALSNFLKRMYKQNPFEGVRVVEDYNNHYLLSVLALDPSKYGNNESTMCRVASVKAMSQASRFFNGSSITDDLIIKTTETQTEVSTEMIEQINEHSIGYVNSLELLTSFEVSGKGVVYIYYKKL